MKINKESYNNGLDEAISVFKIPEGEIRLRFRNMEKLGYATVHQWRNVVDEIQIMLLNRRQMLEDMKMG